MRKQKQRRTAQDKNGQKKITKGNEGQTITKHDRKMSNKKNKQGKERALTNKKYSKYIEQRVNTKKLQMRTNRTIESVDKKTKAKTKSNQSK